jgi:citrate lyase subunit beta/citryl-CoA lyase
MLTWLYVPGDRPDMYSKAAGSGADVVIVDLEDAVAPDRKQYARQAILDWLRHGPPLPVEVRVNAVGTPWVVDDLEALNGIPIRLPKVESADDVQSAADLTGAGITCLIETALGVERAFEIASAHPRVAAIGLGEADLAGDLGTDELGWCQQRIVVAARAAGRPAPAMSVYPDIADLDGLAASCRAGRARGFRGRAAIHPSQIPVIREAFRPSPDEVADAQAVLAAYAQSGGAVTTLPDRRMVDAAMIGRARRILDEASRS